MQATTCFHHGITKAILQEADFVFHDSVTFHPTNGVFNTNSDGGNSTIGRLLRRGEFPSPRGFLGLEDGDARQEKPLKALILIQATAGWQGVAGQLRHALIRSFPLTSMAQEAHVTGLMNHEEVFERVAFLLPTVMVLLFLGIFWAVDWSFSTIMPKRGDKGAPSVRLAANISANASALRAGSKS